MGRRVKSKAFFATLLLIVIILFVWQGLNPAYAEAGYTNVMTDLRKDSSFNVADYPDDADDYSIQVIQIAESDSGELFIYTYQPCQKTTYLVATQVNMSLTEKLGFELDEDEQLSEADKPKLYGLTLLNSSGVLCKYKVNDFTVSKDGVRYYNITSIFRAWDKNIDGTPDDDNELNAIYSKVGKLYKAETVGGAVHYYCKTADTVEILNPYVDFLSYHNGLTWGSILGLEPDSFTDVHYIAFSTDKRIDALKEADVTYTTQSYTRAAFSNEMSYGEKSEPQYKTLSGENDGAAIGSYAGKYTWKAIQRTQDFIDTTNLNASTAEHIKDTEFVLVFHSTQYTQREVYSFMQGHGYEVSGTKVSDVSILRLMFETDGKTYNLGTLMNQQEGDDVPGNQGEDGSSGFFEWLAEQLGVPVWAAKAIIYGGVALIVLAIVLPVLSVIFPIVGQALKYLLQGLWYVFTSPFRLIAWIANKIRSRTKE